MNLILINPYINFFKIMKLISIVLFFLTRLCQTVFSQRTKRCMIKSNFLGFLAFLLILTGGFFSCTNEKVYDEVCDEKVCDVCDPLYNLPWLKEWVDNCMKLRASSVDVYQCTYNDGITGFYIEPCVFCSEYVAVLLDCQGNIIWRYEPEKRPISNHYEELNIKNLTLIWKNYKP